MQEINWNCWSGEVFWTCKEETNKFQLFIDFWEHFLRRRTWSFDWKTGTGRIWNSFDFGTAGTFVLGQSSSLDLTFDRNFIWKLRSSSLAWTWSSTKDKHLRLWLKDLVQVILKARVYTNKHSFLTWQTISALSASRAINFVWRNIANNFKTCKRSHRWTIILMLFA